MPFRGHGTPGLADAHAAGARAGARGDPHAPHQGRGPPRGHAEQDAGHRRAARAVLDTSTGLGYTATPRRARRRRWSPSGSTPVLEVAWQNPGRRLRSRGNIRQVVGDSTRRSGVRRGRVRRRPPRSRRCAPRGPTREMYRRLYRVLRRGGGCITMSESGQQVGPCRDAGGSSVSVRRALTCARGRRRSGWWRANRKLGRLRAAMEGVILAGTVRHRSGWHNAGKTLFIGVSSRSPGARPPRGSSNMRATTSPWTARAPTPGALPGQGRTSSRRRPGGSPTSGARRRTAPRGGARPPARGLDLVLVEGYRACPCPRSSCRGTRRSRPSRAGQCWPRCGDGDLAPVASLLAERGDIRA